MDPADVTNALASLQMAVTIGGDVLGAIQACLGVLEEIERNTSEQSPTQSSGTESPTPGGSSPKSTAPDTGGFFAKLKAQFGGIGSAISSKIVAVLAPVALVASAIAAETSGFGVFFTTIKLLTMVMGTALLPFFVILGAAVLALTGYLMDKLLPSLAEYYTLIIGTAISAIESLVDGFNIASEALGPFVKKIGEWFGKASDAIAQFIIWLRNQLGLDTEEQERGRNLDDRQKRINDARAKGGTAAFDEANKGKSQWYKDHVAEQIRKEKEAKAAAGGMPPASAAPQSASLAPAVPASASQDDRPQTANRSVAAPKPMTGGSFMDRFMDGLKTMTQELMIQSGPKAQSSSIADAAKRAQMAALNQSPIEAKMLEVQQRSLAALQEAVGSLGKIENKSGLGS